ncbi:MAG: RNA pyrophosphohydrolase [Pseudomonadota bacterium]
MIDSDGFRLNVGIILANRAGRLFWAKRCGQNAWQFPQGGIDKNEKPVDALYRELQEELGLHATDVKLLGVTSRWLRYRLPKRFIRYHIKPICIGQKQKWYMLKLLSTDDKVCLDHTSTPEFDHWRWVNYWEPVKEVIAFKRYVYRKALAELEPLVFPQVDPVST